MGENPILGQGRETLHRRAEGCYFAFWRIWMEMMKMRDALRCFILLPLPFLAGNLFGDSTNAVVEALWTADLVHCGSEGEKWVISPAVEPTKPQRLADVLTTIFSKDRPARLKHIALGTLFTRADLQADVTGYLQKQELFQKSPPPFGQSRWDFKNSGEMQKLVADALLQSKFVASLNNELAAFEWRISSVSMEKLYFTKENEKVVWHAIVWFKLDKTNGGK
jgi:hypothetical protein